MFQTLAKVVEKIILTDQIILVTLRSEELTNNVKPGQFVNVRVSETCYPYLRRPFSYCDVEGNTFKLMFTIYGQGTKMLANASIGSEFDVIGPLGNGFNLDDDFENAIFVGGGLGIAPFPFFTRVLKNKKNIYTYIGARTKEFVVTYGLQNYKIATDDGSIGFNGNVVELLKNDLDKKFFNGKIKIFGCGPTPMLRALKQLSEEYDLICEVSTEEAMACGFGICQGCPIELSDSSGFKLVCKDGPVFNVKEIKL
ncbi:MAG: dihydroorotate dehydrogenase electron transfer subunit [Ignavibacteria bacterium]